MEYSPSTELTLLKHLNAKQAFQHLINNFYLRKIIYLLLLSLELFKLFISEMGLYLYK